jgi:hypothetical protein
MSMFKRATKQAARGRIALAGPSGSGKTYTALLLAQGLGGPIAVIDTERGSASKYADIFEFDVVNMEPPYHPKRFIEGIDLAAKSGYKVLIIDSISHAWNGTGGLLEEVDKIAKRQRAGGNSFAAWKDATPIQNAFIDAMTGAGLHLIVTMRSKQEYIMEQQERRGGRKVNVPKKVGMAPIQRDGVEYEFDLFIEMDIEHTAMVSKSRCPALADGVYNKPGRELGETIGEWLSDGAKPVATPGDQHSGSCTAKPRPPFESVPRSSAPEPEPDPEASTAEPHRTPEEVRQEAAADAVEHADRAADEGIANQGEASGEIEAEPRTHEDATADDASRTAPATGDAAKAISWYGRIGITRTQLEGAVGVGAVAWEEEQLAVFRAAKDAAEGKPGKALPAFLKAQLGIG